MHFFPAGLTSIPRLSRHIGLNICA